jgi:hypothetical protein
MAEARVWVFFYGSYMNLEILREVELVPKRWEVGRLSGFDIRIQPRANLVRSDRDCVYGVAATATDAELARLYAHARDVLGAVYLPEAVLIELPGDVWRPCLCYICPDMATRPADAAYLERIVRPARELGFPEWYVNRLESFLA